MAKTQRTYMPREYRISANPADRNFVSFGAKGSILGASPAQFSDVSMTGMKLISRHASRAKVGETVDLQFSLPGSKSELKARALVVRIVGEFEFAVSFLSFKTNQRNALQSAIQDYLRYLKASPVMKMAKRGMAWVYEHRQGLAIATVGLVIFAGAFAAIYYTSDEYHGRDLKSWGRSYPKQWDWDYYNKIPKKPK